MLWEISPRSTDTPRRRKKKTSCEKLSDKPTKTRRISWKLTLAPNKPPSLQTVVLLSLRKHHAPDGCRASVAAGFCGRFHGGAGGEDVVAENHATFDGLSRAEDACEILP